MLLNTKYRSNEPEIMDDFAMKGEILKEALDKIAIINTILGGNKLTLNGVGELLKKVNKGTEITILDVGCGNGDMLRTLADFGIKNSQNFRLIGIDANDFTISYAKKLSNDYPNISYRCEDVFDKVFTELKYDIVLCTLTLHHFKEDEILQLMTIFNANSRIGIVINDLHRSAVAYRLFQLLCFIFKLNPMSRNDGLISILRGFKQRELVHFSKKLNVTNYKIQWKWAFRYQWIIKNDIEIIDKAIKEI